MLPRGWIIVLGKKEKQKLSFSMQAIFCVPSSTMVKFSLLNLPPWPMPGPWGVSDGSRLGPRESKTRMRSPMMTLGRRDQIWMTLKAGTHRPNRWMSEAIHPSIHPLSSAYPGPGCGGSCLSRDTQTSLFPDTYETFGVTRTRSGTNLFCLRRLAFGCLSHWILWLAVCQLYDSSDWRCAGESAQCVGGAEYCVHFVFLSTLFRHSLFSCFGVQARE